MCEDSIKQKAKEKQKYFVEYLANSIVALIDKHNRWNNAVNIAVKKERHLKRHLIINKTKMVYITENT